MDWEPSHGRIRVMLGRSGKVICILKVDPVSSTGRGDVQVVRVEGSSRQTEIERLQVCLLSLVNCERATLEPSTLPQVITITLVRCYLAENEILTHLKPFLIRSVTVFFWNQTIDNRKLRPIHSLKIPSHGVKLNSVEVLNVIHIVCNLVFPSLYVTHTWSYFLSFFFSFLDGWIEQKSDQVGRRSSAAV